MRIAGEWFRGADGVVVPAIEVWFTTADGQVASERFLIDSGADRTVFSLRLLTALGFDPTAEGTPVAGVGGSQRATPVSTALLFRKDDSTWQTVRGNFVGLLDPTVFDLSLLGRDVLDFFDVILSRRRDEVVLLAGNHAYAVTTNP